MAQINQAQKKKLVMQTKKVLILMSFFKKKDFNARFTELESKIPSISGLVAAFPLSSVENKIKKFS